MFSAIDAALSGLTEVSKKSLIAQRGFETNLQALKAADAMLGTILDVTK